MMRLGQLLEDQAQPREHGRPRRPRTQLWSLETRGASGVAS
ncbi:hypothetical protein SLNWT_3039 [Streptomyces albus]|uniref:Uncharacterized protein n=1 Tax=Streptomyces albus (strain ATCC 21838 / DSM 41398 / FERM P-419 / JCM 4703 / NBRC 107858) TaxID=1081613 RepID=A0A0B5EW14_STRA4|nr:hypothetical protein SLNWT_3039 [Streptomyces albus]AOU77724.1 hypothetical protein SLNHY_3033 [Streptomyces albus]